MKSKKVEIKGTEVSVISKKDNDYISITDIARYKNPEAPADVIKNWLRNKNTIELLGLWEQLNNENFKLVEFDQFKTEAGYNHFVLSPKKWTESTNAIGLQSKSGRYGGTFAHIDIALEFASWVSVEFKFYLLKEFQRLKTEESDKNKLEWNVSRTIAKLNYRVHTDAIKEHLIPVELSKLKQRFIYADEADLLNLALFGKTAKQWREENSFEKGNIRDFATMEQLVVLANIESFNSELIKEGEEPEDRLEKLNKVAISQMKIMIENKNIKKLK
ncbi:MAG: KilA-N domain-containing protein [Bacteroidota bacterium]